MKKFRELKIPYTKTAGWIMLLVFPAVIPVLIVCLTYTVANDWLISALWRITGFVREYEDDVK